jgi:hypothetical protein
MNLALLYTVSQYFNDAAEYNRGLLVYLSIDGPEFGVCKSSIENVATFRNFTADPLCGVMASKVLCESFLIAVILAVIRSGL